MNMKKTYILILLAATLLSACSPRVADIFDDTAVVRLEQNREVVKERLMKAENGWVMQYFAVSDQTTSDTLRHKGYTFLFKFQNDGTVIVGAPVDGKYKTETSLWDIISDNSTVLTFNSFNSIFHYYSNPDPALGLWGADGTGIGGDYEFMVLEYNEKENYQLLKGKKRSCYVRLYPMATGQDWEEYFTKLDSMDKFLFEENLPLGMYVEAKHLSLYNGPTHEFRVFEFGADTLGGGEYHGFIVTENGIRLHDNEVSEQKINRASFNLNADKTRLVSVLDENIYIEMEGSTAFESSIAHGTVWKADSASLTSSITAAISTLEEHLHNGVGSAKGNKNARILRVGFSKANKVTLDVYYSSNGKNELKDQYYFDYKMEGGNIQLTYDGNYGQHNLINYNGEDFVKAFDGTYSFKILEPFHPSKGLQMSKTDDANFTMTLEQ